MLRKKVNDIVWYEFNLLQPFPVKHAIFTKKGDLSFAKEDQQLDINIDRAKKVLQTEELVFLNQVHGRDVERVDRKSPQFNADGMIAKEKNLTLVIRHADCQAAIFYDKKNHAIANVHAGWRGNVVNIYKRVMDQLEKEVGTNPTDVIACISPSIGPNAAQYKNYREDFPEHFWKHKGDDDHFNLWEVARDQLLELNIPEDQIEIASMCTHELEDEFFSYRRGKDVGRNATMCTLE